MIKVMSVSEKSRAMFAILLTTIDRSKDAVFVLLFYFFVIVIIFACLMYGQESGNFRVTKDFPTGAYYRPTKEGYGLVELSPFYDIPSCLYWAIVTVTTLGYGDLCPTSQGGRVIASCAAFFGLLCVALPVSVLGSNFNDAIKLHSTIKPKSSNLKVLTFPKLERMRSNSISTSTKRLSIEDVVNESEIDSSRRNSNSNSPRNSPLVRKRSSSRIRTSSADISFGDADARDTRTELKEILTENILNIISSTETPSEEGIEDAYVEVREALIAMIEKYEEESNKRKGFTQDMDKLLRIFASKNESSKNDSKLLNQ